MSRRCAAIALWLIMLSGTGFADKGPTSPLRISPAAVTLDGPEASQQLVVAWIDGRRRSDATRSARYRSTDPGIAVVSEYGRVLPRGEGAAEIVVEHRGAAARVAVEVHRLRRPEPVSFRRQIIPILSKAGCNSGGCHGKAEGQNGLKLSVFGFDVEADHRALVRQARGRRISVAAPPLSLMLRKATAETPHGGGRRIEKHGVWYRRLARWIAEGARLDDESTTTLTGVEVEPAEIVLAPRANQQLRVTATDASGARRCVTLETEFQSNAGSIVGVDRAGWITAGAAPGEAAIFVRYMGQVAVCRVTVPRPEAPFDRPPENNFIDGRVWDKLERLGVRPSPLADDATFLRRVSLDTIGALPTVKEARAFLADQSADKRGRLIDRLLDRDEYADYWAMRWADILRVDQSIIAPQGAVAMTRWLRRQFRRNTPYDRLVRDIVTARGNTHAESPAAFYQVHKDPDTAARAVSQVFLGVRIECAQCHHHPFERWGQRDYYAFAGFFTGVGRKTAPHGAQKIVDQAGADLNHPRSGQPVSAAGVGAAPAEFSGHIDRRAVLADWMTAPDNPYLARMLANRLWAHYFGRGLVEPVDDMRQTNPATNEPLLNDLAQQLVKLRYDVKAFTRLLLNSRAYQLASRTNDSNAADSQNHSHAMWKPLPAEVLLDNICRATAVPERFNGWPEGYRAVQVWDNRMPSYFLRVFGRPQRTSVCQCERGSQPSMAQALHLMNSPETVRKIRSRDGRAAALAKSDLSDEQIIETVFLAALSRLPSAKEAALLKQAFAASGDRRAAVQDVLWVLLNTKEFVYNH